MNKKETAKKFKFNRKEYLIFTYAFADYCRSFGVCITDPIQYSIHIGFEDIRPSDKTFVRTFTEAQLPVVQASLNYACKHGGWECKSPEMESLRRKLGL